MRQFLLAALIALSTAGWADDVVLEDGRRIMLDREMILVPNPDTRVAMFIVQLIDGSKTVESVGVSGCLSDYGMLAHGPATAPSARIRWTAKGERPFDLIARIMCDQKTSGAKYAELLRVPLTTVRQPFAAIGDAAFHAMLDRIARPDAAPRHITLGCELIIRDSTRPPKK